jgi:RNA polymerase sigma-70 factor (ECF subfamily)
MMKSPDKNTSWDWLRIGDRKAFGNFYRQHAASLHSFVRRCVGDPKAAEDIVQETFLQLWQHPNGFNPERAPLRVYLFGIAARRSADWWRRRPPETALNPDRPASPKNPPMLVEDAFEKLDPDSRSLLWLREVEGYSYRELAEMLAIPVGTVRSRLYTAREHLRQVWKGEQTTEAL